MSAAAFDQKFGSTLVALAPTAPGVYRYLAADASVLYVGKAKNLRRRLASYRNATRKKVHRKRRVLVREAHALTYETCSSEREALLLEAELIRTLRPPYNVAGAYAFLYPYVGWRRDGRFNLLCLTTHPEQYAQLELVWFGCFRSRPRVKLAFDALIELFELIGHREPQQRLPEHPRLRGSRLVGLRQLPAPISDELPEFLGGRRPDLVRRIATTLLDKPRALQRPRETQELLNQVVHFFDADARPLHDALRAAGAPTTRVSQEERDALFIRAAFAPAEGTPTAALKRSRP